MSTVVAIAGSPAETSRTAALAGLITRRLGERGHETRLLAVRDLPAAALLQADTGDPAIAAALDAVAGADGVVVATPIYQAAYSGLLKALLDVLPRRALAGKAVLPVATAGTIAHLLAIDYGLRPVLSAMGARHIVSSHLVLEHHVTLGPHGTELEPASDASLDRALASFASALIHETGLSAW